MADSLHWFPGHMNKALHEIEEKIKIVDVVIELLDSRCPFSSINPLLDNLLTNKKTLLVLTKPDLADQNETIRYVNSLKKKYSSILILDLKNGNSTRTLSIEVNKLGEDKREKDAKKGLKPQPIKAMILGIPNVGKSSLINRFAKRKAAGVQNKPGFTRGEQWINVDKNFLLLDTPGILPMNYDDKNIATKLALVGSIKETILDEDYLSNYLLDYLLRFYPNALEKRFGISDLSDKQYVFTIIAENRKLVTSTGKTDLTRAKLLLLKEFRDGNLGNISLEKELCL